MDHITWISVNVALPVPDGHSVIVWTSNGKIAVTSRYMWNNRGCWKGSESFADSIRFWAEVPNEPNN